MRVRPPARLATAQPVLRDELSGDRRALVRPRARRWYMNGKVEIQVGNQTVWAQVGMNITIPGSAAWKEK